jgi:hypothetical protein
LREGAESLNLKPLLLTIGQVLSGWTANVSSDPSDTANRCPRPKGLTKTQNVSRSFVGRGGQQLVEVLTTYSIAVEKAYGRVLAPLNNCKQEKVLQPNGKSVGAEFRRMSLPILGNQSDAFDATWTDKGKRANIYEVVIRSGNIVVTITERGSGSLSLDSFEGFAKLALSKLPFGGTPPPTVPTSTTTT